MKPIISITGFWVLILGITHIAMAISDSNSIVRDDIEYYIQTDKSVYNLGEDVEMLYRVTNLGVEDMTFSPLPLPEWNFWVERDGDHIWRAVNAWYGKITEFTLRSGESREFPALSHPYVWDMQDDEGNLVTVGDYSVIGGLYDGSGYYDYTKVNVHIEIVPEPASFLLFALAGLFLKKRKLSYIFIITF
jgi:hypothetical protein